MLSLKCAISVLVFAILSTRVSSFHFGSSLPRHQYGIDQALSGTRRYGTRIFMTASREEWSRRRLVVSTISALSLISFSSLNPADASLVSSPPDRLINRYFLLRAGQSYADALNQIQTHPIYKLHMSNGLTNLGRKQIVKAAQTLKSLGAGSEGSGVLIWHDISSRCLETSYVLCDEMGIGRERVVPEYAFLEPRGMGRWESGNMKVILPQLYKADEQDISFRPPPNDDGTLSESVLDVLVRVRQLLSKLETQYGGEDIVIVAPDSDCLSILQAFVLGEEFLSKHSRFFIRAGEVRPMLVSEDTSTRYSPATYPKAKMSSGSVETSEMVAEGQVQLRKHRKSSWYSSFCASQSGPVPHDAPAAKKHALRIGTDITGPCHLLTD